MKLFSSYVLPSEGRSCDNTRALFLSNFLLFTCIYICRRNLQNTKNEIPLETFDQEENKTFKLKRSKKASRLNNI